MGEMPKGGLLRDRAFAARTCPCCGSSERSPEVRSRRRAETLGFEALRPYWTGFGREKPFFSYHRCAGCGLLYAPVFFDEMQLADLYAQMAPNMDEVPSDALAATQRGYFDAVRKDRIAAGGSLQGGYLEIGPDIGYVLRQAAAEGDFDHFWLFEPNRAVHAALADAAGGRPNDILADMDDLSPVPDGSIGLAVMVHVLDHLLDPRAMLEQIRRTLRPGGTLMLVTHNEASLLRKVMGRRWPPFCLQHPEVYSPASITHLLRRAGYGEVQVNRSRNYFPIGFLAREAGRAMGLNLDRLPLPATAIGLRLGNIITLARA